MYISVCFFVRVNIIRSRLVVFAIMKHFLIMLMLVVAFTDAVWGIVSAGDRVRQEEECRQLGFNKAELKCHYCQPLLEHTGSEELHGECLACCAAEDQTPQRTYVRARIEQRGISYLVEETRSELGMFYKAYKDKFGNRLRLVEKFSFYGPRLVLEDGNGGEDFEIGITGWTKDTLHDYLVQALGMQSKKE
ncbi:hypothetical protein TcBrA4_0057240 [Trypanosoma cruzi]|nr:hypothetical protein TcBrA4_0057240 [Trypanosoma cruzi]